MRILALAVLFAVMQTAPPVPRKAPDNSAQTSAPVKSKSEPDQAKPLPSPAPLKTDSDGPAKGDSNEQRPENAQHTVEVSKLPPVTLNPTKRDLADWAYWIFNFMLAAVGCFQVWLLYRTLAAISRQADQMVIQNARLEESIGVSRESVQVVINKERARIRFEVSEDPKLYPHDSVGDLNELGYTIFCEGPTPAFIVNAYDLRATDSKAASENLPHIPVGLPTVLHPSSEGLKKSAYIWQKFEQDLEPMLYEHRLFLHFYGIIEYTDVFDKPRFTKFRYVWSVRDEPFYSGHRGYWIKNGSEEDNKAT
jgi:hypothetical protein